jgi:acid phosphatase
VLSWLIIALLLSPGLGHAPAHGKTSAHARVAIIVLENRSYEQIIGNPSAPYLNSLARTGTLATHYYAVTHPSLPNYVALTTGQLGRVKGNCARCLAPRKNLVKQMERAGVSWRAYYENLPDDVSAPFAKHALYNRHYNPFAYMEGLDRGLPARLANFRALMHDLHRHSLPEFSVISPNVVHDGHNARLAQVDRYTARLVPRVLRALGPRGVLYILWDEGSPKDRAGLGGPGGGHVPLIALGPGARARTRIGRRLNHYSLLRTVQHHFGLRPLGAARTASRILAQRESPTV